jgi:hypothetical protein
MIGRNRSVRIDRAGPALAVGRAVEIGTPGRC